MLLLWIVLALSVGYGIGYWRGQEDAWYYGE